MSLFNRRKLLISLAALPLAGCGFAPVYGTGGTASQLRGAILVDEPNTRDEFDLVEQLENRLGRADAPRYGLTIRLTTKSEGLAIIGGNDITRYNLTGVAKFDLRDLGRDEIVYSDTVNSFTAYSASTSTVGTMVAQRDAHERLMIILADQITTRLLAAAGRFPA